MTKKPDKIITDYLAAFGRVNACWIPPVLTGPDEGGWYTLSVEPLSWKFKAEKIIEMTASLNAGEKASSSLSPFFAASRTHPQ